MTGSLIRTSFRHCKRCDVEWKNDDTCWVCGEPGTDGSIAKIAYGAHYRVEEAERTGGGSR